jgi:hypothetical protein
MRSYGQNPLRIDIERYLAASRRVEAAPTCGAPWRTIVHVDGVFPGICEG